jgi:hypothetical protein
MSTPEDVVDQALARQAAASTPASTVDPIDHALSQRAAAPVQPPVSSADEEMADKYGSEGGPGYLLENSDFWRGAGRGALRGYLSATGNNPQDTAREAQEWSQRFGIGKGTGTPEGTAGETIGGFLAPFPGSSAAEVPEAAAQRVLQGSPQSISAAAATPDLANASPALRAAVEDIHASGGSPNPQVLERHIAAESLPVPAPPLTKGQATQDPILISQEQNQRGVGTGAIATRMDAQNQNMIENLQTMRDRVGPDVFSTNPTEHGEGLIQAYQAKNASAESDIASKYQALRDAAGGQFPVDAQTLRSNVANALHQNLLYEHAPSAEMRQLDNMAEGGMNLEQYEAMRTNLARIMRSSSDGNEVAAAGIIRTQMEQLPMAPQTAQVKGLADEARAAARSQFQALAADPAYSAAVNGKVSADRFVNRFIVNGSKENVAQMRENFSDNPAAQQTMGVAALDNLRQSARVDELYRGNFTQAGFNKALQSLGVKVPYLFSPEDAAALSNMGDVARWQQYQPRGSYVSNSGTAPAMLAQQGKELAANTAEGLANRAIPGVGTLGRMIGSTVLKGRAARAFASEHLAPGAGLDYPSAPPGSP